MSETILPSSPEIEETTASEMLPVKKSRLKGRWLIIVAVIIILASLVVAYRLPGRLPFLDHLLEQSFLPVALVDGSFVTYQDLTVEKEILQKIDEANQQTSSPEKLTSNAFDQLINEKLLFNLADHYGLRLTPIELEVMWQNGPVRTYGDEQQAADQVKSFFGWTVDQYKERVLSQQLLVDRLNAIVAVDPDVQADKLALAQKIQQQAANKEVDFAELVSQYSDDTATKLTGGDLGFFSAGTMVPAFEKAAFALEVGQVSAVVKTEFGYHVILVTDKKAAEGDQPAQVKASHVLISFNTFDSYVEQLRNQARVIPLLAGLKFNNTSL